MPAVGDVIPGTQNYVVVESVKEVNREEIVKKCTKDKGRAENSNLGRLWCGPVRHTLHSDGLAAVYLGWAECCLSRLGHAPDPVGPAPQHPAGPELPYLGWAESHTLAGPSPPDDSTRAGRVYRHPVGPRLAIPVGPSLQASFVARLPSQPRNDPADQSLAPNQLPVDILRSLRASVRDSFDRVRPWPDRSHRSGDGSQHPVRDRCIAGRIPVYSTGSSVQEPDDHCQHFGVLRVRHTNRRIQISVSTAPEDKNEGQCDEDKDRAAWLQNGP